MKILMILVFTHMVMSESSQKIGSLEKKEKKDTMTQNLQKLQDLLHEKLQTSRLNSKVESTGKKTKNSDDLKNSSRKAKSMGFFPFFPPSPVPFGLPPGFFYPQNKEIVENSYPNEWLSRTEPFKKNPPLLDSPTYYIRLPPNPYIFVPGLGYVSRPPSLSDPEVVENNKPEQSNQVTSNDIIPNPFYRVPINFLSNGKPTSVYQLPNGQAVPKPESSLINLNKGPYVFNGKPSEIFLIAQIYDALYGDELSHFYP